MSDLMVPAHSATGQELCECGHPLAEHAESGWGPNTVCVEKLATFPDGGWYGVCPCVRHDDATRVKSGPANPDLPYRYGCSCGAVWNASAPLDETAKSLCGPSCAPDLFPLA